MGDTWRIKEGREGARLSKNI